MNDSKEIEALRIENERLKEENKFLETINVHANNNLIEMAGKYRSLQEELQKVKMQLGVAEQCISEIEGALLGMVED